MGTKRVTASCAIWEPNNVRFYIMSYVINYPTTAFGLPMCCFWNRNWRFKLLKSIVSKSTYRNKINYLWFFSRTQSGTTSIFLKPERTRFFNSSHPIPVEKINLRSVFFRNILSAYLQHQQQVVSLTGFYQTDPRLFMCHCQQEKILEAFSHTHSLFQQLKSRIHANES